MADAGVVSEEKTKITSRSGGAATPEIGTSSIKVQIDGDGLCTDANSNWTKVHGIILNISSWEHSGLLSVRAFFHSKTHVLIEIDLSRRPFH